MLWFRRIQRSDYAVVDRLLLQLHQVDVQGRPDRFRPCDHYMPQEAFENLLENENILAFLAVEHGQARGCCFVSLLEHSGAVPHKSAYIDLLVVDQPYRRKGIGRAMFRHVQRYARKAGADTVELMVYNHNQAAINAYRKYGMTPQRSIYEYRL